MLIPMLNFASTGNPKNLAGSYLEVIGQLSAPSIPRVHGDEDARARVQRDLFAFKLEFGQHVLQALLHAFNWGWSIMNYGWIQHKTGVQTHVRGAHGHASLNLSCRPCT
eukprot:1158274-Pelagomonas_calceolata.AAC.29